MQIRGGYWLRVLRVDLTNNSWKVQRIDPSFAVKYIGGRGWGARMLWDEVPPDADPLGPRNNLYIMTGPLTGTAVPGAGKTHFVFISPHTGIYGDSNVGGMFGVELKQAGFDGVVLEGAAKEPVYVWIDNGDVEIKDASHLWGKGAIETEEEIKKELGDYAVKVAAIGPAGENLVKIACVTSDFGRQAGRAGVGAVMGSKKVKAVAVRGDKDIPVAYPEKLKELFDETMDYLLKHKDLDIWIRQGTSQVVVWANENACFPTRNFSASVYEKYKDISGDVIERKNKIADKACFACPMSCGIVTMIKHGPHKGVVVEGPEYETLGMLGGNCALPTPEDVIYANYLCDDLGLDSISAGGVIAFAIECFEKGLIDEKDTGGLKLKFGEPECVFKLLEMIAMREGIGDLLAEGVKKAAEKIGKGAEKIAMHVKGLEISAYEHRAAPAMALAYATCDIGAHHNRAWAITYDIKVGRLEYTEDKVKWVIYLQHIRPLFDALGTCRLQWVELGLGAEYYAKFYTAVTGVETTLEELLKRSEMIWNLTRAISVRRGLRNQDWLPRRVFEEPTPSGPYKGAKLDEEKFKEMVKKYYELRGWDEEGVPTPEKLRELGLEDVAEEIAKIKQAQ